MYILLELSSSWRLGSKVIWHIIWHMVQQQKILECNLKHDVTGEKVWGLQVISMSTMGLLWELNDVHTWNEVASHNVWFSNTNFWDHLVECKEFKNMHSIFFGEIYFYHFWEISKHSWILPIYHKNMKSYVVAFGCDT